MIGAKIFTSLALVVLPAPLPTATPAPLPTASPAPLFLDNRPSIRPGASFAVPLYGTIVHLYDAPDNPYAPGHRGIDIAALTGSEVKSSADGTVSFAGNVAGNLSVSIDHADGTKTTHSYLGTKSVITGQPVLRGQPIGTVGAGHPGSDYPPHVHLSARRSNIYFDPVTLWIGTSFDDLTELVQ